ncbi:hypothetical protein Hanom_Chr01g00052201 [Helianthus anomalus]
MGKKEGLVFILFFFITDTHIPNHIQSNNNIFKNRNKGPNHSIILLNHLIIMLFSKMY